MHSIRLLILGKGEIARCLARIARAADYPVSVCEPGLTEGDWPAGVKQIDRCYTDAPWRLPDHTHAVIARGHEGDALSVASLLDQGAAQVYLIASVRRAQLVMQAALPLLRSPLGLERLSAPAGLGLGGYESTEIALAILAEIQWRRYGGPLLPLRELRQAKVGTAANIKDDATCPGRHD